MNGAHVHLLVNHIPLFAVSFGLATLVASIARRSAELRGSAIVLFVIAGICGWIALETGESAEELVEHLPGVTKALIHAHEEAAEFANISTTVVAVASLVMAALGRFKPRFFKASQIVLVLLALLSSAAMARTAYLGGQVRHTEIRADAAPVPATP